MKTLQFFLSAFIILFSLNAGAQKGTLRGTVIDETGQPLFSANVVIKGTQVGNTTDFDGAFELSAPAGTYNVEYSFIGYAPVTITDVEIKAGDVTVLDPVKLEPSTNQLAEVVITSEQARNTEQAMLTVKKKSVNVLDGISSQTFRKIGDGDAAAAVTRVPGVSVQGGKYVFVRGLGDRYTKTQLNGLDVPGLDPDRNALQMDIFPTNVIDNIVVLKSFTADLPADFVGGLVNIQTKEFPSKSSFTISGSLGFTPGMHLNDNFLAGDNSSTDWLGFDNGYRDEPLGMGPANPQPTGLVAAPTQDVVSNTYQFNQQLDAMRTQSFMNYGIGVSGGDQIKTGDKTYGYNVALSYKKDLDYYDDYEQNIYRKPSDDAEFELRDDILQSGALGVENTFTSVMVGGAMKDLNNKYQLNILHLQNGESRAAILDVENIIGNSNTSLRDNLEYSQRGLTNIFLEGTHQINEGKQTLEWSVSPTYSAIRDKDVRATPYLIEVANGDTSYSINPNEVAFPTRLWRDLTEIDIASKASLTTQHTIFGREGKLKVGAGYTFKTRDFSILDYELIAAQGSNALPYTGNANELLTDEFIYNRSRGNGLFYFGNFQPSNTFDARQQNIAAFASEETEWSALLKTVVGLRVEKYDQFYTGQNQIANTNPNAPDARVFENENVLSTFGLFPTASVILSLDENSNLRGGYFKTVARPSFKEKSAAQIVDPLSGLTFIGNIDLQETDVQNFDLRYEYFFPAAQTIAVSGFYKSFTNPIELVAFKNDATSFQPRNVGDARVMGVEVEGRMNFGFITEAAEQISLNTNISIIDSRVEYDRSEGGVFEGRQNGLREGEELGDYRDMQGQAPYIINTGLSYSGRDNGIQTGLYYNVQGPKLEIVGLNLSPDVYSVPFHSLNFNFNKKFGEDKQYQIGLSIDNLLDYKKEAEARSYQAQDRLFRSLSPGRTFAISFSYDIR